LQGLNQLALLTSACFFFLFLRSFSFLFSYHSHSTNEVWVTIVRPGLLTDEAPGGPGSLLVETGDNLSGDLQ
jgi:hypothetical protein